MSWVQAVKEYAKLNGGKFVIPKRDSDDYIKIRELQVKLSQSPAKSDAPVKKEKPVRTPNMPPANKVQEIEVTPILKRAPSRSIAPNDPTAGIESLKMLEAKKVAEDNDANKRKVARKSIPKPERTPNVVQTVPDKILVAEVKVERKKPVRAPNVVMPIEKEPEPVASPVPNKRVQRENRKKENSNNLTKLSVARGKKALEEARARIVESATVDFK